MEENSFNYRVVMIVDDAKIDRFLAERNVLKHAFADKVVSFESAILALDYLVDHEKDEKALPGLIFLDINMPGMNGFEFLAEYRKLSETIKSNCVIVMLSSSLHPEDKELALSSPYVRQFVNKPLTGEKLRNITFI